MEDNKCNRSNTYDYKKKGFFYESKKRKIETNHLTLKCKKKNLQHKLNEFTICIYLAIMRRYDNIK